MTNRSTFAEKIRSREPVLGVWLHVPHPIVAETLSQTGYDFILIDGEHAPIPTHALGSLLPGTELHDMPTVYRVAWNRIELIKAALDHGVNGLMVPMVNTPAEAADAVAGAKYPPLGKRGMGAWRASNYYLDEDAYLAGANADTGLILQIETREALASVEEIAATPGLDALYVGPADLAQSLGLKPGQLHPELLAACEKVSQAARRNGVAAGIDVASLDYVETYRSLGFSLLTHGIDMSFLIDGGRALARDLRARLGG